MEAEYPRVGTVFNYLSLINEYTLQYVFCDEQDLFKHFPFKVSMMLNFSAECAGETLQEEEGTCSFPRGGGSGWVCEDIQWSLLQP